MGLKSDGTSIVVGRPVREEGKDRYKGFFDYLVCGKDGIDKITPNAPKQVIARGMPFKEIKDSKEIKVVKETIETKVVKKTTAKKEFKSKKR
jgi:hypothetical protein